MTRRVRVGQQTLHVSVGLYSDGRPGELFVDVSKAGTALRAWCGAAAKLISLMLQYQVPLCEIVDALAGTNSVPFEDVQVTGDDNILTCSGELDYVVRMLAADFPVSAEEHEVDAWDVLADALDRVVGNGCTVDDVREQLRRRGAEEALDILLAEFSDDNDNSEDE